MLRSEEELRDFVAMLDRDYERLFRGGEGDPRACFFSLGVTSALRWMERGSKNGVWVEKLRESSFLEVVTELEKNLAG